MSIIKRNPEHYEFTNLQGFNDSEIVINIINCLILTEKFIKASETNFNLLISNLLTGSYPYSSSNLSNNYNINTISYNFVLYVMMKMEVLRKSTYTLSNNKYKFVDPIDNDKDLEFSPSFYNLLSKKDDMKIKDRYLSYFNIIRYELNRMNTLKYEYIGNVETNIDNSYSKYDRLYCNGNYNISYETRESYSIDFDEYINQNHDIVTTPAINSFLFFGTSGQGAPQNYNYRIWQDFNYYPYNPDCKFDIITASRVEKEFHIYPTNETKNITLYPTFALSLFCQITDYYNDKRYLLYPESSTYIIKHNDTELATGTINIENNLVWDNDKEYYFKTWNLSPIIITIENDDILYYDLVMDYSNIDFNDLYEYKYSNNNRDYFEMKKRTFSGVEYMVKSSNCFLNFNVGIGGY